MLNVIILPITSFYNIMYIQNYNDNNSYSASLLIYTYLDLKWMLNSLKGLSICM